MPCFKTILFSLLFLFCQQTLALGTADLLPANEAFQISAKALSADKIELSWDIAEGYYLYSNKTKLSSETDKITLGIAEMPAGKVKHDEFFGDTVTYRNQLKLIVPIVNDQALTVLKIKAKYQGCADIGICYPPQTQQFSLNLPQQQSLPPAKLNKPVNNPFKNAAFNLFQEPLLPAEQAFQFIATVKNANTLQLNWNIAYGYYLYREKIKLSLIDNDDGAVKLGEYSIPLGSPYHDEAFGQVQIFHQQLDFELPLIVTSKAAKTITLQASYQGCAERGVCYPPITSQIELQLPEAQQLLTGNTSNDNNLSEQDQIFQSLQNDSFALTLLSFFGFGLLLAFTPCIFPMIPILSGIIVGQGDSVTTRKAFLLSLSYVLASALTYTVFGILAALFGSNLQSIFQEPWVIATFSGIFILLSFSMFGFYNLELPKSFQSKLHNSSDKHRDGSFIGAAIMGSLSSLIVGPCVAAPLAGALIYIGQTGDVVLGGSALFVMGFAMGSPLLLLGASAGSLLPKAGHWLNSTKAIFGVLMLAVSVWMLDRILPPSVTMLLAAALLIIPAMYLRAIDPLPEQLSGWHKLWKGCGLMMLTYGVLLLIGVSIGNTNPLQPLRGIGGGFAAAEKHGLNFQKVASVDELDQVLEQAKTSNKWVMLDFYADWCISCKEMENYTFTDQKVQQQLSNFILVQADVTQNSAADSALLKRFNLIGPPAILFFAPGESEKKSARVIGYQPTDRFLNGITKL